MRDVTITIHQFVPNTMFAGVEAARGVAITQGIGSLFIKGPLDKATAAAQDVVSALAENGALAEDGDDE